jgi:hypothetical protein
MVYDTVFKIVKEKLPNFSLEKEPEFQSKVSDAWRRGTSTEKIAAIFLGEQVVS